MVRVSSPRPVSIYLCVRRRSSLRLPVRCDDERDWRGIARFVVRVCTCKDGGFDGRVYDDRLLGGVLSQGSRVGVLCSGIGAKAFTFPCPGWAR